MDGQIPKFVKITTLDNPARKERRVHARRAAQPACHWNALVAPGRTKGKPCQSRKPPKVTHIQSRLPRTYADGRATSMTSAYRKEQWILHPFFHFREERMNGSSALNVITATATRATLWVTFHNIIYVLSTSSGGGGCFRNFRESPPPLPRGKHQSW